MIATLLPLLLAAATAGPPDPQGVWRGTLGNSPVVACFDNETTHVNRLKSAFPEATVVWLRTDHSLDAEPLPPGTPAIDGFLL